MRACPLALILPLFLCLANLQAASPVANNDSYATPANALLTVPAPGVLGNDTDADFDTLTVSPIGGQPFSFAGFNFDQASTPTTFAVLPVGVVPGGFGVSNTATPTTITTSFTGFPTNQTGFLGARSIGRFFEGSSGNTVKALNLPAGNVGTTARSGFALTWTNGLVLTNVAGAEFVIYESGSLDLPEAGMVQVHDADNNVWTRWVYQRATTNAPVSGGGVFFGTPYDLSDFGLPAGARVDGFRVVNMIDADRMDNASGIGFVQPGEGSPASAFRPDPGPQAGFTQYGASTLDPDPAYLGILQVLVPTTNAFDSISTMGAVVMVGTNGNFTYDPRNAAALQALNSGATAVDTFTYTATDGGGNFATATVSVTVTGVNANPVANADSGFTDEITILNVAAPGVLGNDTDQNPGNVLTVTPASGTTGQGATYTINADGSYTYNPLPSAALQTLALGITAADSFTYSLSDGNGGTASGTVNLVVMGRNARPVANPDTATTTEETPVVVSAPGLLGNDTDTDAGAVRRVRGKAAQVYSFAGYTFNQASTPDTFVVLTNASYDGAIITSSPASTTIAFAFPDDTNGFAGNLSIGRLFNADPTTTPTALNLPASLTGTTDRSGFVLSFGGAGQITNAIGTNDFVVYESGSLGAPEGFMVQVRNAANSVWSRWVYQPARSFAAYPGGTDGAFATPFDLSDFAIAAGGAINAIRLANLTAQDRMESASGTGFVIPEDNNATSTTLPNVGPLATFTSFGNATLDPDILYVGVVNNLETTNGFDAVSTQGAAVVVNADGGYTYDPRTSPTLQALTTGQSVVDTFTYTVSDGLGGFATNTVSITVNGGNDAPAVALTSPTNNATFVVPVDITLTATASDVDGTVTNVQFYAGALLLGNDTTPGYSVTWSSVPPGNYQLTAVATDNQGLMSTSSVVNITVLSGPPSTVTSAPTTNSVIYRQSGLLTQVVRITNPTAQTFPAVRVNVTGLPAGVQVYNATGTNAGVPFLQYNLPLAPGAFIDLTIEYYVPLRNVIPSPTLVTEVVAPLPDPAPVGTAQAIDRSLVLVDGSFLIDFSTLAGRTYYMQYRTTLADPWKTAVPSITGTGSRMQWIDNGPPKTDAHPSTVATRFYQVILLP
jgi:VCBS repeat-containing protein